MTLDNIYGCIRIARQGFEGNYSGLYCVELRSYPDDTDPIYLWIGISADTAIWRTRELGRKLAGIAELDHAMVDGDRAHARFLARSPIAEYARTSDVIPAYAWEAA